MGFLGRFQARWFRLVVTWLIICLLANAGLADSIAAHIARALSPIADATVVSGTTTVDSDLVTAGFDLAKQRAVVDWPALSPLRKIETAYLSAERAAAGSGEDFLAIMSKQLAMRRPTLGQDEPHLRSFLDRPSAPVRFASLREPLPHGPGDLRLERSLRAITRHVDGNNLMLAENLLRAAGLNEHDVYEIMRASEGPSRHAALRRAVALQQTVEAQADMVRRMAKHLVDHGPSRLISPEIRDLAQHGPRISPDGGDHVMDGRSVGGRYPDVHTVGPDGPDGPDGNRGGGPRTDDTGGPGTIGRGGPGGAGGPGGPGGAGGGGGGAARTDGGGGPRIGGGGGGTGVVVDHAPSRPGPAGGLQLGGIRMEHPAAKPIHLSGTHAGGGRMSAALGNIRFGRGNGGVSFGEIAAPAPGTRVPSLTLRYEARRADGQRVVATVAGKDHVVQVPDWVLIPAAAWSHDKDVEVLTGFGQLEDPVKRRDCRLAFNYAPALEGTLIGLRLMQADIVMMRGYGDLFKLDGRYVLGEGEREDVPSSTVLEVREHKQIEVALALPDAQSYVLTDADQRMTFAFTGGRVVFTGSPVYRLWKTAAMDWERWMDDVDELSAEAIAKRAAVAEQTLRTRLAGQPLALASELLTPDEVVDRARRARSFGSSKEGQEALRDLEDWVRQTTVVLIPAAENPLADPKTIAALNPTVYRAVTQFAQLAAWFRYVQASHPPAWAAFIRQIPAASTIKPRVQLPTCIPRP